jgi:hypothetical protein
MAANDRQVGGSHYKIGGEEHWDRVHRLGLDYFQAQITKYVERWKNKGGVTDLEKALHVLEKYIELESKTAKDKAAEVYQTVAKDRTTVREGSASCRPAYGGTTLTSSD